MMSVTDWSWVLAVVGTSVSGLGGEEALRIAGACELLAHQLGQEQQCAPGPVVAHNALRLPAGVAGHQGDVADRLAASLVRRRRRG